MLLRQVLSWLLASNLLYVVRGHGYLIEPPSRNAAWRKGFETPTNHDDNGLNCGGFSVQWETHEGKCGVCGDEYGIASPLFIYPGLYATGTITKNYTEGQQVQVEVQITANHKGWFEFRLGKIGAPPITQEKLTYILQLVSGGTRWRLDDPGNKKYTINLQLPAGLTCEHCVLQWWYNAGNSWGCDDSYPKNCGLGFGEQETFVNCADVTINGQTPDTTEGPIQGTNSAPAITEPLPTTEGPIQGTTSATTTEGATFAQLNGSEVCKATGPWTGDEDMDIWCTVNCGQGYCPDSHCVCETTTRK